VAYAWMPEARRIRADADGGPLGGGAPRAVWLALGSIPGAVSVQSAAQRLITERRPCHLIWDPVTGEVAQLVSALRAGRALGAPDRLDWSPDRLDWSPDRLDWSPERIRGRPRNVNTEGRVCVQIGVLAPHAEPFTDGPLIGVDAIVTWLDSWGVARRWPSGQPAVCLTGPSAGHRCRSHAHWARGGHFGASQVPGCENAGPGAIDTDRLTGGHMLQARHRDLPVMRKDKALAIPALSRSLPCPPGVGTTRNLG
jgi:hypothetical protein